MMESGKYGREWHDESSKEAPRNTSRCLIIKNNLRYTNYDASNIKMIPTIIPDLYRMEQDPSDLWWQAGVDDDQVLGHCGGDAGL
jgi:hypothetical protein